MKDLHCHILYGIDDGCKTIDESIKILKSLYDSGVDEVIMTPHYIENSKYDCDNSKKKNILNKLSRRVKKENIPIKLHYGNEIYLSENILKLINEDKIHTLYSSKYLLIELPIMNLPGNTKNIFDELIHNGYRIILAHPERYYYVMNNIDVLKDFINIGVLLQCNYTSLYGMYGKKSKSVIRKLLRKGWVSFLCSDIHNKQFNISETKLRRKLRFYLKKESIDKLLNDNFNLVIKNKNIVIKQEERVE